MGESNYQWPMLLKKFVNNEISPEELAELHRQINSSVSKKEQFDEVTAEDYFPKSLADLLAVDREASMKRFKEKLNKHYNVKNEQSNADVTPIPRMDNPTNSNDLIKPNFHEVQTIAPVTGVWQKKSLRFTTYAAAALIFLISAAIFYLSRSKSNEKAQPDIVFKQASEEPALKEYSYILVGANLEIKYEEMKNGMLLDSNGVSIKKMDDQILIDTAKDYPKYKKLVFYIVTAPHKLQKIRFPDGSLFTLDAVSYIGPDHSNMINSRAVQIYGRAYCDINRRPKTRFTIQLNDSLQVYVTGTKFSVRNYKNENPLVALIEGKVTLSRGRQEYNMKPGEQVELTEEKTFRPIRNANVELETSWTKRILFIENKNIYQVMPQIATFYNRGVRFDGPDMSDSTATGKILLTNEIDSACTTIRLLYNVRISIQKDSLIISKY